MPSLDTRIFGEIGRFHLVHHLERWEQTRLIGSRVFALRKAIPMIARNSHQIANFHVDLVVAVRFVRQDGFPIVRILSSIVINIVQRSIAIGGIGIQGLHDFVGHATYLRAECTDEIVA